MTSKDESWDRNNNKRDAAATSEAEAAAGSDKDSGSSIGKSTELDVEMPCSPCLLDAHSKRIESVVFCLECKEYLCLACRKQHCRFRPTRGHHLLEISDKEFRDTVDAPQTETCPEHFGRSIDHYCEDHDVTCCKSCVEIGHSQCTRVKYIPDESENIKESTAVNATEEGLLALVSRIESITKKKRCLLKRSKEQEVEAIRRVKALTNVATGLIDKLADEAKEEISRTGANLGEQLTKEIETCDTASGVLKDLESKLKTVLRSNNEPQIYISLKEALKTLNRYSKFVLCTEENMTENNFSFITDKSFESMLQSVTSMGSVSVSDTGSRSSTPLSSPSPSPSPSRVSLTRKKAIPIGGHSVRIKDDRTTCHISGCKFLSDGRLLLADYHNKCIKLFDTNFRLVNYLRLRSRPVDLVVTVTVVTGVTELVTSLADDQAIQFVKVTKICYADRKVLTIAPYHGLTYSSAQVIYASCSKHEGVGQIHVIDMDGNVIRTIDNDNKERPFMIRPTSLHVDDERGLLYVVDPGRNCVLCLDAHPEKTNNPQPLYIYTDRNLELRVGMITADNDDSLYVTSGNRSVHQISTSCQKIYEILTAADGISVPFCLAFSARDGLLFLSEFKENCVKLFKMTS